MSKIFINLISFYQKYLSFDQGAFAFLAPGGSCKYRFYGELSCSEYMKKQIKEKGALRGTLLGLKRIGSCR